MQKHARYYKMRPMVILRCRPRFSVVLAPQKSGAPAQDYHRFFATGKELWRNGRVTWQGTATPVNYLRKNILRGYPALRN